MSTDLLNTPVKLVFKNRLDHALVKRTTRKDARECTIEVNEPLDDDTRFLLARTVLTVLGSAVNESAVCTYERRARLPVAGILGDIADEEQDGETAADFVLLNTDACGPVEVRAAAGR